MFESSCPMLRYGGQRRFLTDEASKGMEDASDPIRLGTAAHGNGGPREMTQRLTP